MRRGAMMEFRITEAEAREMARLEEESGCDITAGTDWGIHLDKIMELALRPIDKPTLVEGDSVSVRVIEKYLK
jgi:hypothetical protein